MDMACYAESISKSATRAMAAANNAPMTESNLKLYREDANSIAAAIVRAIARYQPYLAGEADRGSIPRSSLIDIAGLLDGGALSRS